MNRALLIVVVPVLLVAAGYVMVFRAAGVSPGYGRLAIAALGFFGLVLWASRLAKRKPSANG